MTVPKKYVRIRDMKNNNFWMITSAVLLAILISILVPGAVTAQNPSETNRALLTFERIFRYIENNYVDEVDPQTLLEGALSGLFDSLDDPHSTYLTDVDMRGLNDTTSGEFGGVGMYITKDTVPEGEDAFIRIIAPIEDTPSDRLGIQSNDLITKIEGEATQDFTIDDAVNRLRGPVGEDVEVEIRRGTYEFVISITRAVIMVPTIRYALIPNSSIGYIRIIQFTPFTVERVQDTIAEFKAAQYQKLIVDVRQNPGGLLSSVVDVSDLFLSGGTIVGTSGRNQLENRVFNAKNNTVVSSDIQVVVLIDQGSASASEIFAGALGDRERATIIGQQSYGKGSVQQVHQVENGAFRLTMSKYYTPSGTYIDKVGIIPDILAESETLTEEQTADITELLSKRRIQNFVDGRQEISDRETNRFITEIVDSTSLDSRTIGKLVRDEVLRSNNTRAIFDLEYDQVLQEAIRHLEKSE